MTPAAYFGQRDRRRGVILPPDLPRHQRSCYRPPRLAAVVSAAITTGASWCSLSIRGRPGRAGDSTARKFTANMAISRAAAVDRAAERVVIRAGVIDRGRTVKDPDCWTSPCRAPPCCRLPAGQHPCRMVEGRPIVFEINARFSGGIPLTIEAGADFPQMLAELALGRRVAPSIGRFRDNVWMTNYEASVFLEQGDIRLELPAPRVAVHAVAPAKWTRRHGRDARTA